jgi:hypothetical protein
MRKFLLAIVALLVIPAHALVTQSAQLATNTLNFTVNIVTQDTSATAISAKASTSGTLSCSTYPGGSLYAPRNAVNIDLADFSIGAGLVACPGEPAQQSIPYSNLSWSEGRGA